MNKILSITAGRSSGRPASFPEVLLYRGRAADGADCLATFDKETIVLSRPVAGLSCRIRLSTNQYQAVATIAREDRHVIHLMHRDPGLSVDLAEAASLEAAEDHRDRLAEFLDLPTLTLAGRSASGDTIVSAAAPARRRKVHNGVRRPRFLSRRKSGNVIAFGPIAGREIIARS